MANMPEANDQHGALAEIVDSLLRYLERERENGMTVIEADRDEVKKLAGGPGGVPGAIQAKSEASSRPVSPGPGRESPRDGGGVFFCAEPWVGASPTDTQAEKKKPARPAADVDYCIEPPAREAKAAPAPVQKVEDRQAALDTIAKDAAACRKCVLHGTRTNVVPGQGSVSPEIMFVGEAPGADEDQQGLAFVGRAGQLLTNMIEAMDFKREQVFIANILKCRPPDNRTPMPDEMAACLPFLRAQISILKPRVIVTLGGTAVRGLFGLETGITKLRGKWLKFDGIPTMPTLHPAYLLRNPAAKMDVWADMLEVLRSIGRKPRPKPGTGR